MLVDIISKELLFSYTSTNYINNNVFRILSVIKIEIINIHFIHNIMPESMKAFEGNSILNKYSRFAFNIFT